MAELHPQLKKDCLHLGRFSLCHLLLMQDAHYPWFILVPDREGICEIHQLSKNEQYRLIDESAYFATIMEAIFKPDKLNIAALGNIVPQLHVHHIARYEDDIAWPAPVWGKQAAKPYSKAEQQDIVDKLKTQLVQDFKFYL